MKKVLIITYYWPPAGGPGVQRIVKFTKLLPDFGWQPIILTVENPTSPAKDESLLEIISENCKVYKTATLEPFNIYKYLTGRQRNDVLAKDTIIKTPDEKFSEKISRNIRANLFIPDARVGWIPSIIRQGLKIIREENVNAIFSTSPPHSLQLGAKALARKTGVKWIADFRDPWTEAYWESELSRLPVMNSVNRYFERKIFRSADAITTVSEGLRDLFIKKAVNNYHVLYHGFTSLNAEIVKTDKFKIIYLGNMSKYQSPEALIKAIQLLPIEVQKKIIMVCIGRVYNIYKELLTRSTHMNVELHDFMPYKKVMSLSKSASLLLTINPISIYGSGLMAAKTYDYITLRKPILAFGSKGGELEQLLVETESGKLFENDQVLDIKEYINDIYVEWIKKGYILLGHNHQLEKYSVEANVKDFADLLDKVAS